MNGAKEFKNICVYCASSPKVHEDYFIAARQLGREFAKNGITTIFGGGGTGLMGELADSALETNGNVIGVIPKFMEKLEWSHRGINKLHIVETLHERKELMAKLSDAIVALPGGCGTFEELMEIITWKRLGIYFNPVIIVNVRNYYAPLIELLENSIKENFMNQEHADMWSVVDSPEDVLKAIRTAPKWSSDARNFAAVKK